MNRDDPSTRPVRSLRQIVGEGSVRHRRILALAIPAIVTLIADPLLGAVDTAVAGRLGSASLGSLGLAVSLLAAATWIFNFLVFGTTTAVAQAMGRGDVDAAGERVTHASVVAVVLGVGGALLLVLGAPLLVAAVGAVDELVAPAVTYLRVRAVGVPFLLLGYVGHGAFRGVGDTRTPLAVVIVANVLNGLLDVVLVFGFGWGLPGIAAATVVAEITAVAVFAIVGRRAGLPMSPRLVPSRAQVRDLVTVSRDLLLRTGGLLGGLLVITAAAARVDTPTAAAHQVLWQLFLLVSFLMDGFAVAAQHMIGEAIGRQEPGAVRAIVRDLTVWGAVVGAVLAVAFLAARDPIVAIFTSDPVVVAMIGGAWWIASAGHLVNAMAFVFDGVVMGAADFAYLRTWTVAAAVVAGVLAQAGVSFGAGLTWLWICVEVLMLIRAVALALRVRGTGWLAADLGR